mgnify:CR=1 FL=1
MTRDEFLNRLGELLACLPADQVKETQEFYAEAIADRMEDGMTEAGAVAAMGTPGEVAEATLDELPPCRARSRGPSARARHFYGRSPSWALRYDSAAARVRRRCRCSLHLYLGSCALRVDRGRGIRGRGPVGLLFAVGRHHYRACSGTFGLDGEWDSLPSVWRSPREPALDGVQADRALSALWAKKAVSPFWKDRGNKSRMGAEAAPLTA